MKKLFLIMIIAGLSFTSCTEQSQARLEIAEQSYTTHYDDILYVGDAIRFKVFEAINNQQNKERGTNHKLVPHIITQEVLKNGNELGFYINGVWIPYSQNILNKGLAAISANSHIPAAKLFDEALCQDQGARVRSVYAELDPTQQIVCTDGNLICSSTVSVNQAENNFPVIGFPWWWLLLALLLLLLLIFLLNKLRNNNSDTHEEKLIRNDLHRKMNNVSNNTDKIKQQLDSCLEEMKNEREKKKQEEKQNIAEIIRAVNEGTGPEGHAKLKIKDEVDYFVSKTPEGNSFIYDSDEEMVAGVMKGVAEDEMLTPILELLQKEFSSEDKEGMLEFLKELKEKIKREKLKKEEESE